MIEIKSSMGEFNTMFPMEEIGKNKLKREQLNWTEQRRENKVQACSPPKIALKEDQ